MLGTPDRGSGQVLVEAGAENDVAGFEVGARLLEFHVVPAERRAPVARDVATGVEPGGFVTDTLLQGKTHECLYAGHVDPALGCGVLVVEVCFGAMGCQDWLLAGKMLMRLLSAGGRWP